MSAEGREPTEEEMRAALEEQMRNIRVEDVVLQTTATLINLAGRRVGLAAEPGQDPSGDVDLQQAKLAIDGAMALAPLCPPEQAEPIKQALSQLQMAYSQLAGAPGGPAPEGAEPGQAAPAPDPEAEAKAREEEERAKARSKLWTPGSVTEPSASSAAAGSTRCSTTSRSWRWTRRTGRPRRRIRMGQIEGTPVAFMPRHGDHHELPAAPGQLPGQPVGDEGGGGAADHRPVRLRHAQGRAGAGHVRGLRPVRGPHQRPRGHLLRRPPDHPRGGRRPLLRRPARHPRCEAARELDIPVVDGGTVVVIQGPRFSTRAESRWFAQAGWDVVNMTQYPEAWLARELELCYANVSLVTDYDAGLEGKPDVPAVSAEEAFRVFADNLDKLRALLFRAVPTVGPQPDDSCATALASAIVH